MTLRADIYLDDFHAYTLLRNSDTCFWVTLNTKQCICHERICKKPYRDLRDIGCHPEGGKIIFGGRELEGRIELFPLRVLLLGLVKGGLIGRDFDQVALCKAQQSCVVGTVHNCNHIPGSQMEVLV